MIASAILRFLKNFHNSDISNISVVTGGSINNCYSYTADNTKYFLKFNSASQHPDIIYFDLEGISAIANTHTTDVPAIVVYDKVDNYEVLVLPFIEQEVPGDKLWERFGERLAAMHAKEAPYFGWPHSNYIGSLQQSNQQHKSYLPFFVEQRLQKQVILANQHNLLSSADNAALDSLQKQLSNIIPNGQPSLVHGDLWSGNFIAGKEQTPYLIDPAIHYSFRETDLAFTYLFGGFNERFYKAYQQSFPLTPDFKERIGIYNLYPLLVHLNLFGRAYLGSIRTVLTKFR